MNFVENNGKKVAAVLCVASCFPVVATVYAMETQPGWHGDKYVNNDSTVAKGWQEIEGKNYYFSEEDGTIDADATQKATAASVSSNIVENVKETVTEVSKAAVEEEKNKPVAETEEPVEVAQAPIVEEAASEPVVEQTPAEVAQAPVVEEPADVENTPVIENTVVENTVETPAIENVVAEQPVVEQPVVDQPVVEEPVAEQPVVDQPVVEEPVVEQPVVDQPVVEEPVVDQPVVEEPVIDQPVVEEPVVDQPVVDQPVVEEPVVDQPVVEEPVYTPTDSYSDLNAAIAANAQTLVGVTDGLQCTQVVQQALAMSGVSDAYQLWPDQYVGQYGYYTDTPTAGNLIYYDNGGRGVDHIAIYIGDGQAVHGNYNGQTVIASVYDGGVGAPQYIQVQR